MISYTLKCSKGHRFESWFQSAAAFDTLKDGHHLSCAICGSSEVEKAVMAPAVSAARNKAKRPAEAEMAKATGAGEPTRDVPSDVKDALQKLKAHVEANSDYVGTSFAKQARDMHLGDAPERPIYGEASPADAKALVEDGVPVLPLPFAPTKKVN